MTEVGEDMWSEREGGERKGEKRESRGGEAREGRKEEGEEEERRKEGGRDSREVNPTTEKLKIRYTILRSSLRLHPFCSDTQPMVSCLCHRPNPPSVDPIPLKPTLGRGNHSVLKYIEASAPPNGGGGEITRALVGTAGNTILDLGG